MKPSLQLKLSQHLALTPQLQQSIRLLQLSTLELNQEIEQALADNPLLERDDDPLATPLRVAADGAIVGNGAASTADAGAEVPLDAGAEDAANGFEGDGLTDWGHAPRAERDDDDGGPQTWVAGPLTLHEHLRAQLALTNASPRDRALGEAATCTASRRLRAPSEPSSSAVRMAPVITTGFSPGTTISSM